MICRLCSFEEFMLQSSNYIGYILNSEYAVSENYRSCNCNRPLVSFLLCKEQIPLRRLLPKLSRGESREHIMKVADTNHLDVSRCLRQSSWQVQDKTICVTLMEFRPLQCTGKVGNKVRDRFPNKVADLSRTQIMKVGDLICVVDLHDLCPRQVCNFVGNLSWTLSQSWCNGIWA